MEQKITAFTNATGSEKTALAQPTQAHIDSILDEPQPQLAAARRASKPLDTSLSVESLGGVTGSRPPRRQRPSSAGAVVGGGFCSSGRAGLNNEEECMDLLGRRPQSAGPTGGSSYATRNVMLADLVV